MQNQSLKKLGSNAGPSGAKQVESLSKHQQQQQWEEEKQSQALQGPSKTFSYEPVLGRNVGEGWLSKQGGNQMPVEEYRKHIFAAFKGARDRYIQRQMKQGGAIPASIAQEIQANASHKSVDPEAPDFQAHKHLVHKFAGICIKSRYQRYFTVDKQALQYFEHEKDPHAKKSLELRDSNAFLEEKTTFMERHKQGATEKGDEWAEPNSKYRVGIQLQERSMKAIYFYSSSSHDAKFLLIKIQLLSNQSNANVTALIEMCQTIEKITRF